LCVVCNEKYHVLLEAFEMFNKVIIAVVGSSNSGKTTAIEAIIKGLINSDYSVGSAKHIPKTQFTIDTMKKDTWKHANAGANPILSVAPNELAIIKKINTEKYSIEKISAEISSEIDVIIIEGFKQLVKKDMTIPKIVATKSDSEILQTIESHKNILAFIGHAPSKDLKVEIPYIDILEDPEKLVELVIKRVKTLVDRKRKREKKITIQIKEKNLPLGDFVQDIIRNSILAMITSLKGVKIKGEEKVSIIIE
jgi:molybdopterin-guanine dinucleotide biosynthesis protein MobB